VVPEADFNHAKIGVSINGGNLPIFGHMNQQGAQSGNMRPDLKKTITQLGIEYRLMTQFTSFVAIEERVVTDRGKPRRIDVPVEVPKGVVRQDISGPTPRQLMSVYSSAGLSTVNLSTARASGGGGRRGKVYPSPPNAPPTLMGVIATEPTKVGAELLAQQNSELEQKLHLAVFAVVQKLKNKQALSNDESGLIHDGKAEVQVWLTEKTEEALAQLKELGFEVMLDAKNSKVIFGRLPVEKLEALAKLKVVTYVAPQK